MVGCNLMDELEWWRQLMCYECESDLSTYLGIYEHAFTNLVLVAFGLGVANEYDKSRFPHLIC